MNSTDKLTPSKFDDDDELFSGQYLRSMNNLRQ